ESLRGLPIDLPLPDVRSRHHREVPFHVDVVRCDDDGGLDTGHVKAAAELLHGRAELRNLVQVAVRGDTGECKAHGSDAIRETSSSRNRSASTSTPTSAFGSRPVTPRRSTTVRPSQSSDRVSTATFALRVVISVGSMTCATATASWIGEPSKPYEVS